MATNEYHFITDWHLPGTIDEITRILIDVPDLPRWWPSVYLDAQVLEPGDADGVGQVVSLYTKGWLPYTLRWVFRVKAIDPGRTVTLEAQGDFVGRGIWTAVEQDGATHLRYDWRVSAEKPLLRRLSFLLKPIFSANHEWAMRQGEISLKLELARRRARTPEDRARIPPPPGPTTTSIWPLALGALACFGAVYLLARRLR
ncbi:MAG TPA: hypothetical protein VFS21_34590 [Roseiflexaceae bacterium]|nr:hypothetical protein [Roseiflexaceae bacterium]